MKLPYRLTTHAATIAAALSFFAFSANAQSNGDDPIKITPFLVNSVPQDRQINPLTREISSVLGDDRDLLSLPRAVSTITTALMNERQIHGVREILLYSPGAYAGASYGKTTVPNIRGDIAETYLNGQRLSYISTVTFRRSMASRPSTSCAGRAARCLAPAILPAAT